MQSCIYEGRVSHARTVPRLHKFDYRVFMMYLDLDELPTLFRKRWLWSSSRPALARFRREDHVGAADQDLRDVVRREIRAATGDDFVGSIRLLTNLAYYGYCFNPVSFYFCHGADDELRYVVAEVTNTPWGERECYVLTCSDCSKVGGGWRFTPTKKMHVSPFMSMAVEYDWIISSPGDRLNVQMNNSKDGKRFFTAGMAFQRREISSRSLASVLVKFPLQTLKIISAIHWEALRLWLKGVPVHAHPDKRESRVTQA